MSCTKQIRTLFIAFKCIRLEARRPSWLVRSSPDRAMGTLHCVPVHDTLLSRCLSPPRCKKWVPVNLMLGGCSIAPQGWFNRQLYIVKKWGTFREEYFLYIILTRFDINLSLTEHEGRTIEYRA